MIRCTKCIMPDTKPGITLDEEGVCNACRYMERYLAQDWEARWAELERMVAETAYHGYKAVVAVSGGKDSHYLAHLVTRLGLDPLLVCVEPPYPTEIGRRNLDNLSSLGYDIFVFKPNRAILPTLLKRSFVEDGQPAGAFEFMLYTVPVKMAIAWDIPFVFWGEGGAMYGNPLGQGSADAMDQRETSAIAGRDAAHWVTPEAGIGHMDLLMLQHPTADELRAAGVRNIYMADHVCWNSWANAAWAGQHGLHFRPEHEVWKSGGYWDFEQLDDEIPVISHMLKDVKYGYGRATDQACRDIRWGYRTRDAAMKLAQELDGRIDPEYIHRYAAYLGISVAEFWAIANHWRGAFWERQGPLWALPENWYR